VDQAEATTPLQAGAAKKAAMAVMVETAETVAAVVVGLEAPAMLYM